MPVARNNKLAAVYAAIVTFLTYSAAYGLRKGFTVCEFQGVVYAGVTYKSWLVISQVLGYAASKFYGIRFISELGKLGRGKLILLLTGISGLSLLLLAVVPAPWNIPLMIINGFPLGIIWGIVFSYIEGRRATDFIGAALSVSFIFASGFVKTIARQLENSFHIPEIWVPFVTGFVFFVPLILFVYLLERIPPPTAEDVALRSVREPMPKAKRKEFVRIFLPGLVAAVAVYIFVTLFRDIRDNFMADMLTENGVGNDAGVFTRTETPITIILLVLIGSMILIKDNMKALVITHWIIIAGFAITFLSSLLFVLGYMAPIWWLTIVGLGLYLAYIPYNCIFFERLMAAFKYPGTVGFLIYVADAFGYLGSVSVILSKELLHLKLDWTGFYSKGVIVTSLLAIVGTFISLVYFNRKHKKFETSNGVYE